MYRKYYSYSDMPQIVKKTDCPPAKEKPPAESCSEPEQGGLLSKLSTDDILLAVIIIALIMDDNADNALIIALAFVFLTGLL